VADIQYAYKPQGPTLEQYILSEAQRTFIAGPLGSSKTNASCWKGFRIMRQQAPNRVNVRKVRIAAVRNTYPDLMGTTVKDWLEMFGDLGNFTKGGTEPPTHRLHFMLDDGTTVQAERVFLALDRPEHVRKLRGLQLTAAWVNEAKELPFAVIQMLDLRVGRYPQDVTPTWYGIYGDTNQPDTDHWYYRLAEEEKPDGWVFLRQPGGLIRGADGVTWVDNPDAENVANLPPGYYLKGAQGKDDDWILVNLANEYGFVKSGKPVYPDYRDSVHCREFDLIPGRPLHIGMDFGLTPAAVFAQRTVMGQWRIHSELVTTDTGVVRFSDEIKRHLAEHYQGFEVGSITGDPAGDQRQAGDTEERSVFQILAAHDIQAIPAHTNDFTVRTEAFSAPLRRMIDGEPGLLIHPQCKVTRKGLQGGYAFKRVQVAGDERYRDMPDKNELSHPCEAGQYLMLGGGEGKAITAAPAKQDISAFQARQRFAA
jgi:hypothetical protein